MSKPAPGRPSEYEPRRVPRHDPHEPKGWFAGLLARRRQDPDAVADRMTEAHDDQDMGIPHGPR